MPVGPYATFDECVAAVMADEDVDEDSARRICGAMEQQNTTDAPTEIRRTYPFEVVRADTRFEGDGLTFEGYAAVFDTPTRIQSWEGDFFEQIRKGAFAKSIEERTPVLQFDHGTHPLVGSIPLGVISKIAEDSRGLFVRARLSNNWLVEPVRDAIRDGAIDGMSFRFNVLRDEWDTSDDIPVRTLHEVRVPEVGPVVFPAYEATTATVRHNGDAARILDAIRAADEPTRRDLAALLAFDPLTAEDLSVTDAADTGTSGTEPGTPPLVAPAVDHVREVRDRVMADLRASIERQEKLNV